MPAPTRALGPYEVLVRNRVCSIYGTDLHEYSHGPIYTSAEPHSVTGVSLPTILGHEFAGVVEAIGAEVRSVRPGDRVAIMPQVFELDEIVRDGFDALLDRDGDQVKILVQT